MDTHISSLTARRVQLFGFARPVVLVAVVALVLAGCAQSGVGQADQDAATDSLPLVALAPDEDAPVGTRGAAAASDYVVLASVANVEDGYRFYGKTDEDPESFWYEDVRLELVVEEVLAGSPPDSIKLRWPAYIADEEDPRLRNSQLVVSGLTLDSILEGSSVFFIKEYEEPFGTSPVALATAMVQVDGDGLIIDASAGLLDAKGESIDAIRQQVG